VAGTGFLSQLPWVRASRQPLALSIPCAQIDRVSNTTCVRLLALNFFMICLMCTLTVLSHMLRSCAISLFWLSSHGRWITSN
jgi:hypothetical protein